MIATPSSPNGRPRYLVALRISLRASGDACIAERGSADAAASFGAAIRDRHCQVLLTPAQGTEIGHRPVQVSQLQQAFNQANHLPERQAKQNLQRQTGLDCRIAEHCLTPTFASGSRAPIHPGIKPDRKRSASLQGSVIGSPVRGFVLLRYGFAHAA